MAHSKVSKEQEFALLSLFSFDAEPTLKPSPVAAPIASHIAKATDSSESRLVALGEVKTVVKGFGPAD